MPRGETELGQRHSGRRLAPAGRHDHSDTPEALPPLGEGAVYEVDLISTQTHQMCRHVRRLWICPIVVGVTPYSRARLTPGSPAARRRRIASTCSSVSTA